MDKYMQKVTGARWNNKRGTIDQDSEWLKKAKIASYFMYSHLIITIIAAGCSHYFFSSINVPLFFDIPGHDTFLKKGIQS